MKVISIISDLQMIRPCALRKPKATLVEQNIYFYQDFIVYQSCPISGIQNNPDFLRLPVIPQKNLMYISFWHK